MDILIKDISEEQIKADVLILPLFEDYRAEIYSKIDIRVNGLIQRVINSGEFTGKLNQTTLLHVNGIKSDKILLIGLGKQSEITNDRIRQSGGIAFTAVRNFKAKDVALCTGIFKDIAEKVKSRRNPVFYFIEGGLLSRYRFERYKKTEEDVEIRRVTIIGTDRDIPIGWLQICVSAVNFAKDLINTPSNDMTPSVLSDVARSISGKRIKVKILQKQDIEKRGMGAYLAVSRGTMEPPRFIILEYNGGKGSPIVFVGKTITFDSGGISIKPSEGMEKMKYDMAGGAVVLAVIKAVAEAGLSLNIVGILPATENLPSGSATKPGDIVKGIDGKTIEIINTDAEGRLTLADGIGYAIKYYKPRSIIDIATLTGACSIALGGEAIAMMGNDGDLMEKLKRAAEETYERVWQMPLYDEYKEYLKSDIADIKNSAGKNGSLVTAGYFLKEFAGSTPWVHLDIASTAWNEKEKPYTSKGATAVGVRLLLNFLEEI